MYKIALSIVCSLIFSLAYAEQKPNVVSTTGMINDVVKNVGGDRINATGLMGSGVDPHLYKATRSDIAKLTRADIVFYNGLMLEGKISNALLRVGNSGKKVYAVTELIDSKYLLEPKEFSGHFDPHVWMDPQAWIKVVEIVRDKLIEFDPKGEKAYKNSAAAYIKKLKELDSYNHRIHSSVPKESRVLLTAHDAFNYFGRRYGYEVLGIQGISTESESGVRDIERLVKVLVDKKIKAVFVESTVSRRNVNALIEGAKAQGHDVTIGGELFSDAMGKPNTYEGTYIGMIDHNATTIVSALGGTVPKKGLKGKLSR